MRYEHKNNTYKKPNNQHQCTQKTAQVTFLSLPFSGKKEKKSRYELVFTKNA